MKRHSVVLVFLPLLFLSNCAGLPARHISTGQFDRAFLSGNYEYMGESEDHSFLRNDKGNLIYTDTQYLLPEVKAAIASQGKRYRGPYSRIPEH